MKSFDLEKAAAAEGGEYVLGMKDLHTHACYMIYGMLEPRQGERLVRPGEGHEEILCAVDGPLILHLDSEDVRLDQGSAVHVKEEESFHISNPADRPVVYIMAGGHSRAHH
jgi:mannose-6-phosphate isomerase-like protein (cupin superfamily)